MQSFFLMVNPIRDYSWGDNYYIPDFLGIANPDARPFAEMWMGAHPLASSKLKMNDGGELELIETIVRNPVLMLGPDKAKQYGSLPFLFKLLAARKSLSIQAHPSKEAAETGFLRENEKKIPIGAINRNYRDDNHKPEIIMAITPFSAMIGFRRFAEVRESFSILKTDSLNLGKGIDETEMLKSFFVSLLTADNDTKTLLLASVVDALNRSECGWDSLQKYWISRLSEEFPGDIGVLAPLFLNVVEIQPGEALFQPVQTLHAYLEGFGLELMANSDNVLRGGLTGKHVDVVELVRVLDFSSSTPRVLKVGKSDLRGFCRYPVQVAEFSLSLANLGLMNAEKPDDLQSMGNIVNEIRIASGEGPLIVLAMEGRIVLGDGTDDLVLNRGSSAFVPWTAEDVLIRGKGKCAIAEVGHDDLG
ncbi:Mannose-6-phosphate isomerase [Olavius algarvensis spirochete endosymbiont]|uniref:mannose-6-phosphate isomerase, class I n=1 Tax=Olavius algarvensis spirochete endosymbiont TaxID=260710 RepID=UPI00052D74C3|nr:mannose-6-phosphate isomerase, class I [Olavius algarvensis spirochete endosymbiont]KGM43527.1 hypothetical protein JY97_06690 [Alkalispirochaeta odontotermitis]VDB00400.1 Mannose-6-phosphate isomerase [Olavius algarvensis spirochete endosymbiont]